MTLSAANSADADLLHRYADEHAEEAFAELVRRHINLVHSAAFRQVGGNAAAAADVTQAVFIELARQAVSLGRHPALIGWLYTTTHRQAARHVRNETRRQRREQEAHTMQALEGGSDPEPDWNSLRPVLDDAMHELGEADRLAVLLRHFEQRTFAEVGTRLGLPENTARMRVERALEKLRSKLARRGVTSTVTALALALSSQAVAAAPPALAGTVVTGTLTALTATATTTSTFGFFTAMACSKCKICLGIGVAAVILAPVFVHHHMLRRLQGENWRLRNELAMAREDLQFQAAPAPVVAQTADADELLRLRGLVAQLQREKQAWTATQRTAAPSGAGGSATASDSSRQAPVPFRTDLGDVGAASPQTAASTFIWAATAGEIARVSELLELPASVSAADAPKHYEFLSRQMSNSFTAKRFTAVQGMDAKEDGTVKVNLGYEDLTTGQTHTFPFFLRQHDGNWKVVVEGEVPKDLESKPTANRAD